MWRLSRYRTPESKPSLLENWGKALELSNYSDHGQDQLRRVRPWILVLIALEFMGVVIYVAYS